MVTHPYSRPAVRDKVHPRERNHREGDLAAYGRLAFAMLVVVGVALGVLTWIALPRFGVEAGMGLVILVLGAVNVVAAGVRA